MQLADLRIAKGMSYVWLPLAVKFRKKVPTVDFTIYHKLVDEFKNDPNSTLEELKQEDQPTNTAILDNFKNDKFFIFVPITIDGYKQQAFPPFVVSTTTNIGSTLKIVYGSTIFPKSAEELCFPVLEQVPALQRLNWFFVYGSSSKQINADDKLNLVTNILNITLGPTSGIIEFNNRLGILKKDDSKVSVCFEKVKEEYEFSLVTTLKKGKYDTITAAIGCDQFKKMCILELKEFDRFHLFISDLKYSSDQSESSSGWSNGIYKH